MSEIYRTARLILRQWKDTDRSIFSQINNDPNVMRYFPRTFTNEESNQFVDDSSQHLDTKGWGAWAIEHIESGAFIGFVGFSHPAEWHPCAGNIDIGWRLGSEYWGCGFATEAATYSMQLGFTSLGFEELVSFTSECNLPSVNVMKKLGMSDDRVGFLHPRIPVTSPLRNHVVYRIGRSEWLANNLNFSVSMQEDN